MTDDCKHPKVVTKRTYWAETHLCVERYECADCGHRFTFEEMRVHMRALIATKE